MHGCLTNDDVESEFLYRQQRDARVKILAGNLSNKKREKEIAEPESRAEKDWRRCMI